MFGNRADGKKVKDLQIIDKAIAYFMPTRIDAVNLYEQAIVCDEIDKFILEEKKNTGVHYTYTDIFLAACVRMLYQRPRTNWFVNDCVLYKRKYIAISISVKNKLTDDGEEITLKMFFKGNESLAQVKEIFDNELKKNIGKDAETHKTTKTAGILCKLPNWMFKTAMWILRWADKHNLLPRKLLDISPFHTSVYFADLKSIHLDAIYHHLYNFGNTTIFATLGKFFYGPVANRDGTMEVKKQVKFKFTLDERVCDGLYYSNSLKLLLGLIENPEKLKTALPEPELTKKELKKKAKQEKKEAKKQRKLEKRNKKKN